MYPELFSIGNFTIYTYGVLVALGFFMGMQYIVKYSKNIITKQQVYDFLFYVILVGIIGARIFYVILDIPYYLSHPLEIIQVWKGGLVYYGGFVAVLIFAFFYCKHKKFNIVKLVDEDVKCKGPLRRAEKEGDLNKISAARQTAISICSEIINMNGKCLELAEELTAYCDDASSYYLLECTELALASSKICISYCLKMSSMSADDTYRYVIRRENELNLQAMQETAERIRELLRRDK